MQLLFIQEQPKLVMSPQSQFYNWQLDKNYQKLCVLPFNFVKFYFLLCENKNRTGSRVNNFT